MIVNVARRFRWRDRIACCYNPIIVDTSHFEIPSVSWMDIVASKIIKTPPLYKLVNIMFELYNAAHIVTVKTETNSISAAGNTKIHTGECISTRNSFCPAADRLDTKSARSLLYCRTMSSAGSYIGGSAPTMMVVPVATVNMRSIRVAILLAMLAK